MHESIPDPDPEPVAWPELPAPDEWQETLDTLHLWSQIVGKVRLENMPWINHSWHVALYVTSNGLSTSLIPHPAGGFEISFDFVGHALEIRSVNGKSHSFRLEPMSVADFYHKVMSGLDRLGHSTRIRPRPVEIPDPILPFPEDTLHNSYDPEPVHRFWRALTHAHRVLTRFRAGFRGKSSPVHFFWGSFDMAVTRFSGRPAPRHPGGVPNCPDRVMVDAYSHELHSAGFWPGTGLGEAAFYAYAYGEPEGFSRAPVFPEQAIYHADFGEFILPYEAVRSSPHPDETLLRFLNSTWKAAAETGKWEAE